MRSADTKLRARGRSLGLKRSCTNPAVGIAIPTARDEPSQPLGRQRVGGGGGEQPRRDTRMRRSLGGLLLVVGRSSLLTAIPATAQDGPPSGMVACVMFMGGGANDS
jgi:hypothetical protein